MKSIASPLSRYFKFQIYQFMINKELLSFEFLLGGVMVLWKCIGIEPSNNKKIVKLRTSLWESRCSMENVLYLRPEDEWNLLLSTYWEVNNNNYLNCLKIPNLYKITTHQVVNTKQNKQTEKKPKMAICTLLRDN